MNRKKNIKMVYMPPVVEVTRVILEGVITASPVRSVNVNDWTEEGPEDSSNNADVWLNF